MTKTYLSVNNRIDNFVTRYNELVDIVGDLASLNTIVDSDIVGAINSIYALVDSATDFRSKISVTDAGGDGSLAYNSGTGVITYTGPSATEVRAHFSAGTNTTYASGQFSISDATIRSKISVTDAGGDGSLSYNSTSGVLTYTGPSATEVRAHISVTDAGGDGSLSYNSTSGVLTYTGPSATEVRAHFANGTNTTYSSAAGTFSISDATIRSKISVTDAGGDGSLSYSSATGVITYTGPSAAEVRAHFSASGDLEYNASTGVFSFSDSAQRTDADIRSLFSATDNGGDGSFSYNSTTGAFSYTGPSASEVRAHFSAGTSITLSSGQISVTAGSITETQLGNDAVSRAKLKDEVGLVIYNSSGTALKTMYGAGS